MDKKILALELTDYVVYGKVLVNLWGGGKTFLIMKPYHVNTLNIEEILAGVNDGGFGCERIIDAEIDIYENYKGYLVHHSTMMINIPPNYGKRGI